MPGIAVAGATTVPGMPRPSTGMSTASSRVAIGFNHRVLGDGPDLVVHAAEIHDGMRWRRHALAVDLDGGRPHRTQRGVGPEGLQRGDLGAARAAHTPG